VKKHKQKIKRYKPSISIIEQKKRKAEMLKKSFKSPEKPESAGEKSGTPESKKDKLWIPPPGSPLLTISPKR
jgi:hypothetical protein